MAQFLGADAAAAGGASLLHPYIGISMRCSFCALRRLPRVRCLVLYPALSVGHFLSVFLGIQKIPGSEEPGIVGAPEGIRTPNLLIRSQMLYPLSYRRMFLASDFFTRRGNRYYYTDVLKGVQAEKLEIDPKSPPQKSKVPRFAA